MAFLIAAYTVDEVAGEQRTRPAPAPSYRPLPGGGAPPVEKGHAATAVPGGPGQLLQPVTMCDYDVTRAIGRRYRRQDEIGTPLCVTVDFESLEDKAVTVRDRDSTAQERVPIDRLVEVVTRLAW